jgi:hypothetical protein
METKICHSTCAVAIVKGEASFIEEWIVYHRLIGIDHFYIYDNDPTPALRSQLKAWEDFVTVIDWPGDPTAGWPGRNLQTKTYAHALKTIRRVHEWVTFFDVDEFIVLQQHENLPAFLSRFEGFGSIRLNWHVFGHNGHYEAPVGLITPALTRRMSTPSIRTKAISRTGAIASIDSAHRCRLKRGWKTADANGRPYTDALYPGKTDIAHINHYQCRSFLGWMERVQRGDVSFDPSNVPAEHAWRLDPHLCLRQFVETVARDKNERVDEYMLRFEQAIKEGLKGRPHRGGADPDHQQSPDILLAIEGSPIVSRGSGNWMSKASSLITRGMNRIRAFRF